MSNQKLRWLTGLESHPSPLEEARQRLVEYEQELRRIESDFPDSSSDIEFLERRIKETKQRIAELEWGY